MSDETAEALEMFRQYRLAFDRLEPDGTGRFYHEPSVHIAPTGVFVLPTRADVERGMSQVMQSLRPRDYHHSDHRQIQLRILGPGLALIGLLCVRIKSDGTELEQFGMTCTLRKVEDSWCIAVSALHAPDNVLRFA